MDGLEATRLIREREASTGRHTPVIAMTASAMKEDRDLCLASGMDAFVSKPIRETDLIRAIQEAAPFSTTSSIAAEPIAPEPADAPPVSDRARWLERLDGNASLLAELVTAFRSDCPTLLTQIDASIQQGNPAALCHAAHTLKSVLRFFDANAASEAALQLETMGRSKTLVGSHETFRRLTVEVDRLLRELEAVGV
jgi:HPt (histidine-containing phosphotransfer) domain-containing protein